MTRIHHWPADTRVDESPHDRELSARLGLPPGTVGFLRLAFDQGLTRSTTWDIDWLPPEEQGAATSAARIFRRGAGNRPHDPAEPPSPEFPPTIAPLPQPDLFIVADINIARLWPDIGRTAHAIVTDGDPHKTLDTAADIMDAWNAHGRRPQWLVYGGGHTLDIAGFAAGLAGIHIHAIPTTLLAMVDAAIGGKTGVNFPPWGKNQVGLFWQPERISVWPGWLETLDPGLLHAQSAECLKHAWIKGDRKLLDDVIEAIRSGTPTAWRSMIPRVVAVKSSVVARDPFERGERAVLNLGHTLGHALESLSEERTHHDPNHQLSHGEAIAAGLGFALRLSRQYADLDLTDFELMRDSLRTTQLWPSQKRWAESFGPEGIDDDASHERLWNLITHDKKRGDKDSSWVLLSGLGRIDDHEKPGTYLTTLSRDQVIEELSTFTRSCRSPEYP